MAEKRENSRRTRWRRQDDAAPTMSRASVVVLMVLAALLVPVAIEIPALLTGRIEPPTLLTGVLSNPDADD